jgi:hypothetical protein
MFRVSFKVVESEDVCDTSSYDIISFCTGKKWIEIHDLAYQP